MPDYKVSFMVTQDFSEEVHAKNSEDAQRKARVLLEDSINNRYAGSQDIQVVKVEEL